MAKKSLSSKATVILLQCSRKDEMKPVEFITSTYPLLLTREISRAASTLTDSLFSSSVGVLGVEAGGGGGGASPFSSPIEVEKMKRYYLPQKSFSNYRNFALNNVFP